MQAAPRVVAAIAAVVMLAMAAPAAAQVVADKDQRKCFATLAKEGAKYMAGRLKLLTKCADKNLKEQGACDQVKRDEKLAKAESKVKANVDKKCGAGSKFPLPDLTLSVMGFPGKCPDPTGALFTNDDLEACIFDTHRDAADRLFALQYGANGNIGAPATVPDFEAQTGDPDIAKLLMKCQKDLGKNGLKFVATILKEVQKCRNGLQKGTLAGFAPEDCADNPVYTKAMEKIAKAESKTVAKLEDKCPDGVLALLDACDTGSGPATTAATLTPCLISTHRDVADNPDQTALADLIDVEYGAPAFCGDGLTNDKLAGGIVVPTSFRYGAPVEECDGDHDAACPGVCGDPAGTFPCLCLSTPRLNVAQGATVNTDTGWNGLTHDAQLLEGSGHTVELFDCDGPSGPDTLCTVGPSCALAPHAPCANDGACAGLGNFCRKGPGANGPHCQGNPQQACTTSLDCPGADNFCRRTLTTSPVPISAAGISACTLNVLSEDIVGTVDVATGASEIRLRETIQSFLGPRQDRPCPLCGGFCDEPVPDDRAPCNDDSDCEIGVTCQLAAVCSNGVNIDQPCRTAPPAGGTSPLFGTTSVDCPIEGAALPGLDVVTDPRGTGAKTLLPSFACTASGFAGNKCVAGSDTGKSCTVDSNCAGGGAGSCRGQCFCPAGGALATQPNACAAACRGGTNDYKACAADSDCPGGGFCQSASCRAALGICILGASTGASCGADSDCPGGICGDDDSTQEGFCPAGPLVGHCSVTSAKQCNTVLDCRPASVGGSCSFCEETEVCLFRNRQCFVNEGISRTGFVGLPTRGRASVFCIPSTGNALVDGGGGFPGPATTEGPETVTLTGFPP